MDSFEFVSEADGLVLRGYHWPAEPSIGTVQIAHGLAEHAPRYDRLATALSAAGFDVWAHDHRGHGASIDAATPHGSFGEAGWGGLVADIVQLSARIEMDTGELPHFLLGHSMGSMAAQVVMLDNSERYTGVVLSGSTAIDVFASALPEPAGEDEPADLSAFNAGFEPRTGFEWLSRDEAEVDKYVADPLCGFAASPDVLPGMLSAGARAGDPDQLSAVSSSLPVLIVSGEDDPLSGKGELVRLLATRYRSAGLSDVELEVYPGARHEVFNEINRDEITARVVDWLRRHAQRA